jgi:uridine kinase
MATDRIEIELENGPVLKTAPGITPKEILRQHPECRTETELPALGALLSNEVVTLDYPIEADATLRFLTFRDPHGRRIYHHSIAFLLASCVHRLFPGSEFAVEHSLSNGFFCSLNLPGNGEAGPKVLRQIEKEMRAQIKAKRPILRKKISYREAVDHFKAEQLADKLNLLRYRNPARVAVYCCNGFMDLAHTVLADSTAVLGCFRLQPYEHGFVILFPSPQNTCAFPDFKPSPLLVQIYREHKNWGRTVGVSTVGDLNRTIAGHGLNRFIDISEAFMEKRIVRVADTIAARRERLRWIMVSGPSSAGKTTFAQRLAVQLQANGIETALISMDDYFVNRDQTPLDQNGEIDYEHLEAVDLSLLDQHMALLESGEAVELPTFNFTTGHREFLGRTLRISKNHMVIMEGIHGLNPRVSRRLPTEHVFKVFVSAITQLNLDANNRISTTDNRLLRRIVRDNTGRSHTGLDTLQMWHAVRAGEKKWIFPCQHEADTFFNSALDYELAVLKPLAEPLLAEVKPWHPQYAEARRLQDFLKNFLTAAPEHIPPNSLLREFIGQSKTI